MFLGSLRVAHLPRRALPGTEFETTLALLDPIFPGAFRLETCQRTLWVYPSFLVNATRFQELSAALPGGVELMEGMVAYAFLLEVATGLQSEVKGETDVFGQLKDSWSKFSARTEPCAQVAALTPWMQKIFEDTKDIRAQHLQHVGAGSYGSLVRKLHRARFGQQASQKGEPILLVGAGQIAQAIAPWLAEGDLWIWNRSLPGLHQLAADVAKKLPNCRIRTLNTEEELLEALSLVPCAVFAIPSDSATDSARMNAWRNGAVASEGEQRLLVHLGGMRSALPSWSEASELLALDDLFALQKSQESARTDQFLRASQACREKARLRSLSEGGSSTLPHGWEDLALFA